MVRELSLALRGDRERWGGGLGGGSQRGYVCAYDRFLLLYSGN